MGRDVQDIGLALLGVFVYLMVMMWYAFNDEGRK